MKEILFLFLKAEYRKHLFANLKQLLYLIPLISITLVMSTTQNIKYINQRAYLNNVNYKSIQVLDKRGMGKNEFGVYQFPMVTVENARGVLIYKEYYECEIFNILDVKSLVGNTPFTKKNLDGCDPMKLKSKEIILSYDAAKKLKVGLDDEVSIILNENEELLKFKIKGIMKTKYAYQNIGNKGTAIINYPNNNLQKSTNQSCYFNFTSGDKDNGENRILLKNEKRECNFWSLDKKSVIMVNVVFPISGLILIIFVLYKEIKRVINTKKKSFAILLSMGANMDRLGIIVICLENLIILFASFFSVLIYKFLFVQRLIGYYVSFSFALKLFAGLYLVGSFVLITLVCVQKKSIEKMDIVNLLCQKEINE